MIKHCQQCGISSFICGALHESLQKKKEIETTTGKKRKKKLKYALSLVEFLLFSQRWPIGVNCISIIGKYLMREVNTDGTETKTNMDGNHNVRE